MSTEGATREAERTEGKPEPPFRLPFNLERVETYRQIPIYHQVYGEPILLDRESHEREIQAVAALPEERFGLVICFRNVSFASAYTLEAQAEVYHSPRMAELRKKAVSIARYNPGSLVSLIRTMSAHIYARHGLAADFAPDFDAALRAVRRGIDRHLTTTATPG